MNKVILSAFADEYSQNFDEQIKVIKDNKLEYIELRNIESKGLADYSFEELEEFAKRLKANNIKVSAIGSPLGKIDITDDFDEHLKKAEKFYKIATVFDTKYIRMFSFYNKTNIPFDDFEKEVFRRLEAMLDLADKYEVVLCHENEALIYGEQINNIEKLLNHFGGRLKAVFDMGNFILDGVNPVEAYKHLKNYIQYFHLKDSLSEGAVVPAGKGEAKIRNIISMFLKEFNKDVIATIEPHLETFGGLNALVGKAFVNPYKFKDAKEAFLVGVNSSKIEMEGAMNMATFVKDKLLVNAYPNRVMMGEAAAKDVAECFKKLLKEKESINVIFAAAPSQNDVLLALVNDKTIPWERINAFHMDEYIGLDKDAPQGFGNFLKEHIFGLVPFKSVNYIDITAKDPYKEAVRYGEILKNNPTDVVVLGIGENGHIAFNDPGVADFNDKEVVKPVKLDDVCRQQQVNDGCFKTINDVPTHAMSLTIPTLFNASHLFCIVPCKTKANAVKETINGTIDEHCPASILRKHNSAVLYLDADSASLL